MVLDKPSNQSLAMVQAIQTNQPILEHEKETITRLKEEQGLVKTAVPKVRKRKKAGGPNPLSCLKKKKKGQETPQVSVTKKKMSRKRRKRTPGGAVQLGSHNVEA